MCIDKMYGGTEIMFTFINKKQMPIYLNEAQFKQWGMYFNQLILKIGLHTLGFDDLGIEFSNDEETSRYGALFIQELKKLIREIWGTNEEIERVLQKIEDYNDYKKLIQELANIINGIRNSNPEVENSEILYAFLKELEFECSVVGRYIHNEKKIVLFTKNIENVAKIHENTPEQEFEKVFIHELFHAYHYKNDAGEIVKRKDYTSKVVKESLASAFEWFYCIENKINGYDELRNSWWEHSVVVYPYSGALDLLETRGGLSLCYDLNTKKFCQVFEKSLLDMDGALRILLESYDFYGIKNASFYFKEIRTKVRTSTVKRVEFDSMWSGMSVGKIAKQAIPPIIQKKPHLVSSLMDRDYCAKTFDFDSYTILSHARIYRGGNYRYFPEVVTVGTTDYYLCSQWYEKSRQPLLDWIWINK